MKGLSAAYRQFEKLERELPTSGSGGQAPEGIQDQVLIQSPDGNVKRVLPPA